MIVENHGNSAVTFPAVPGNECSPERDRDSEGSKKSGLSEIRSCEVPHFNHQGKAASALSFPSISQEFLLLFETFPGKLWAQLEHALYFCLLRITAL